MLPPTDACPGVLHQYSARLVAFEYLNHHFSQASSPQASNYLLWIGGLSDGLRTVRYPSVLARSLPPSWSLAEVLLSSSYTGWATSSLARDADDLAEAVAYFRALSRQRRPGSNVGAKVVLMGHSTGSQDCMEYCVGPLSSPVLPPLARPLVDAIVLQAGISDREGLAEIVEPRQMDECIQLARKWVADGRGDDVLPRRHTPAVLSARPTAARFLSLVSPDPAEALDDYFSSDLPAERIDRIWGSQGISARGVPALVLLGRDDEHMPKDQDKSALLGQWKEAVTHSGGSWPEESGLVPGATHNLNTSDQQAIDDLCGRVGRFLARLEKS